MRPLPPAQAVALGLVQGPAELLPISSSAHVAVIPWLLGWDHARADPSLRKSFEVALHGGTAVALLIAERDVFQPFRGGRPRFMVLATSCLPPAIAGYGLEEVIEHRLGNPGAIAVGLLVGSVLMLLAERSPGERNWRDAGWRDGIWLGIAQASALAPGISRAGATLTAARLLRFRAVDAKVLSDQVALPVLLGATLFEAVGLSRRGLAPEAMMSLALGAGAAFASTLACATVARRIQPLPRLLPYAVYRATLAGCILMRARRGATPRGRAPAPD